MVIRNILIILFEFLFYCMVFCVQIRKEKEKISPNHSFLSVKLFIHIEPWKGGFGNKL